MGGGPAGGGGMGGGAAAAAEAAAAAVAAASAAAEEAKRKETVNAAAKVASASSLYTHPPPPPPPLSLSLYVCMYICLPCLAILYYIILYYTHTHKNTLSCVTYASYAVQPKSSTSWFKDSKKHCNKCGRASTKVDRPDKC